MSCIGEFGCRKDLSPNSPPRAPYIACTGHTAHTVHSTRRALTLHDHHQGCASVAERQVCPPDAGAGDALRGGVRSDGEHAQQRRAVRTAAIVAPHHHPRPHLTAVRRRRRRCEALVGTLHQRAKLRHGRQRGCLAVRVLVSCVCRIPRYESVTLAHPRFRMNHKQQAAQWWASEKKAKGCGARCSTHPAVESALPRHPTLPQHPQQPPSPQSHRPGPSNRGNMNRRASLTRSSTHAVAWSKNSAYRSGRTPSPPKPSRSATPRASAEAAAAGTRCVADALAPPAPPLPPPGSLACNVTNSVW